MLRPKKYKIKNKKTFYQINKMNSKNMKSQKKKLRFKQILFYKNNQK